MLNQQSCSVYIMASSENTVIYIGVTTDLKRRVWEHKTAFYQNSFSHKCKCCKLVYYTNFQLINSARAHEVRIKKWRREKKNNLVNQSNHEWKDLAKDWYDKVEINKTRNRA